MLSLRALRAAAQLECRIALRRTEQGTLQLRDRQAARERNPALWGSQPPLKASPEATPSPPYNRHRTLFPSLHSPPQPRTPKDHPASASARLRRGVPETRAARSRSQWRPARARMGRSATCSTYLGVCASSGFAGNDPLNPLRPAQPEIPEDARHPKCKCAPS